MKNALLLAEQNAQFEAGFQAHRARQIPAWRLAQFQESLGRLMQGKIHPVLWLQENQSRSDFTHLMTDTIDRAMLAGYQEYPVSYPAYTRATTVRDFRAAKRFTLDGAEGILVQINELGPYPEVSVTDGEYTVQVYKYGQQMGFSFEAMVNDDLNALKDTPMRFGVAARRSREYRVTQTFASTANQATFFSVAHANKVTTALGARSNNPPLSADGIWSALEVLSRQTDPVNGQPISIEGAIIVYPENLENVVMGLRNTTQIVSDLARLGGTAGTAGSSEIRLMMNNFMASGFTWVKNSQLAQVNATNGRTGWYMFANPNAGRPALMVAELAGHQTPELFMKSPDAIRVGGGLVDPMEGSFENDSLMYKIRDFIGSSQIDYRAAVFSDGTGV